MKTYLTLFIALLCACASAAVKLPSIFSDNMVLQAEAPVAIWGKAEPNSTIEIAFLGQLKKTDADAKGAWRLKLDAMPKNKTPQNLQIFESGKLSKTIKNVLVGEVWITGGQSNMEMTAGECNGFAEALKKIDHKIFRSFMQERFNHGLEPKDDIGAGQWIIAGEAGTNGMSAISFFFGDLLVRGLDTPVGVVQTAVGGTSMVSWTPQEVMQKNPAFKGKLDDYAKRLAAYDYEAALAKWKAEKAEYEKQVAQAKAEGKTPPVISTYLSREPYKEGPDTFRYPAGLYNGKVAPLAGYTARGFLWYQGESDANSNFKGMFNALIDSWRDKWNAPEMPFLFVQLTSYAPATTWPETRKAQEEIAKSKKHVYMAVTIDLGEEKQIHPKDKNIISKRLYEIALANIYGYKDVKPYGPFFKSAEIKGAQADVALMTFGKKLKLEGEPRGFEVLVEAKWVPAKAELVKGGVKVTSSDGKPVSGVRYLWKNWARPDACIFSEDGLPLAPFAFSK